MSSNSRKHTYLRKCVANEESDQLSEYSLGAFWVTTDATFPHVDNEDRSDCEDVQVGLSFCWAYMSEDMFSHVPPHIFWENASKTLIRLC